MFKFYCTHCNYEVWHENPFEYGFCPNRCGDYLKVKRLCSDCYGEDTHNEDYPMFYAMCQLEDGKFKKLLNTIRFKKECAWCSHWLPFGEDWRCKVGPKCIAVGINSDILKHIIEGLGL